MKTGEVYACPECGFEIEVKTNCECEPGCESCEPSEFSCCHQPLRKKAA
ncbi:MAG: hypothetical protein AAGK14_08485 [Verrucomicrobiota bacterium]